MDAMLLEHFPLAVRQRSAVNHAFYCPVPVVGRMASKRRLLEAETLGFQASHRSRRVDGHRIIAFGVTFEPSCLSPATRTPSHLGLAH